MLGIWRANKTHAMRGRGWAWMFSETMHWIIIRIQICPSKQPLVIIYLFAFLCSCSKSTETWKTLLTCQAPSSFCIQIVRFRNDGKKMDDMVYYKEKLWPYLGKAGLTKIALKRFSVVMHFQRILNALTSISNAFWNIANAFQRKRNALQIHFKKHFQNVVNALANPCQRVEWNRNGPFGIVHGTAAIRTMKSLQWTVNH